MDEALFKVYGDTSVELYPPLNAKNMVWQLRSNATNVKLATPQPQDGTHISEQGS